MKLSFGLVALSCLFGTTIAQATFLPPNNLDKQDGFFNPNITEERFGQIVDQVFNSYKDIVTSHGGNLIINKLWNDPTVNANASQSGTTWNVNMYGGLARRPEITDDGFFGVVCHELGHHLGGYYFYSSSDWASSEGQSDYFATQACLPRIWANEKVENAKHRATIDPLAKQRCDAIWSTTERQDLCYRIADAGASLAWLLSALNNGVVPKFNTPNNTQVSATSTSHPEAQCRLDTYFAGAICPIRFDDNVIPTRNHPNGQNSMEAEKESFNSSCHTARGYVWGVRPRCWYKPTVNFTGITFNSINFVETNGDNNGSIDPGENATVSVGIKNDTPNSVTKNVKGYLTSTTAGITVLQNTAAYPDLAYGQISNGNPSFLVKVDPTVTCGSKAELTFRGTSDAGSAEIVKSFVIGKLPDMSIGTLSPNMSIPDNNTTGISSEMQSSVQGAINSVSVSLDITHTYLGDLIVKLIAPNGTELTLWNKSGGSEQNIKQTFNINTNLASAAGKWTLKVIDTANADTGKLNSWSLAVSKNAPSCKNINE